MCLYSQGTTLIQLPFHLFVYSLLWNENTWRKEVEQRGERLIAMKWRIQMNKHTCTNDIIKQGWSMPSKRDIKAYRK